MVFPQEAEGGRTEGLFGLKAEYLHVLLNPLPVYGLLAGAVVLLTGLLARSKATRNTGLLLTILCAAAAWPVLLYGQHGYNHLAPQLDTESQQWLDAHMERAERFIYVFYLTALLGIAALVLQKKFPKAAACLGFADARDGRVLSWNWRMDCAGWRTNQPFRIPRRRSAATGHATRPMNTAGRKCK